MRVHTRRLFFVLQASGWTPPQQGDKLWCGT